MDQLAHLGAHVFEVLFFCGIVGSVCVVLVPVIEDIRDAIAGDEESPKP
jgi:hypothetical protein